MTTQQTIVDEYQKITLFLSYLVPRGVRPSHPINQCKANLAQFAQLFIKSDDSLLGLRANVQKVGASAIVI